MKCALSCSTCKGGFINFLPLWFIYLTLNLNITKMRANTPEKYFISQLYAHKCQLPPSDDYQHVRLLRKSKNYFLISEKSLESYLKVKSLSGIYYEKRRQVRMTKVIIHPLSEFRKMWMVWMSFVMLLAAIMFPFSAGFHGPVYAKQLYFMKKSFYPFWLILYTVLGIQFACFVDMITNFFTGYVIDSPQEMVIQPWRITRSYLFTYFPVDLIVAFPCDFFLIMVLGLKKFSRLNKFYDFALAVRAFFMVFRLLSFNKYCHVLFSMFSSSEADYSILWVTIFFFLTIHWATCSIVIISRFIYYDRFFEDIQPTGNSSWIFESRLYERNLLSMYSCAWYRSVCCVTRLGFELFSTRTTEDKIISAVLGLYGAIYLLILLVVFLQATSAVSRAKLAYAEIMDQVVEYMEFKRFPDALKTKVTEYYLCLYQKHYIDEDTVLKLASDTLRNEILLRKFQRLIEHMDIFSGLSQTLTIQILSKLKPVIYREGEEVFAAGDYPDCIYFVSFGTFAFYVEDELEIGHLDDGGYFGELSVLRNAARYVTARAIETSLVYTLSVEDLNEITTHDKTLVMKLEKSAEVWLRRMHQEMNFVKREAGKVVRNKSLLDRFDDEDSLDDEN